MSKPTHTKQPMSTRVPRAAAKRSEGKEGRTCGRWSGKVIAFRTGYKNTCRLLLAEASPTPDLMLYIMQIYISCF